MKRLTCEMCGSTDLVKQGGVFVCQTCGCKYTIEEAKKLMVEGAVDVSGSTVMVDNSGLIDNYLTMAQNALNGMNNAEAENYVNKIIEINPKEYMAWLLKGFAAGWQTTGDHNRFPESVACWISAYQFASSEDAKAIVKAGITSQAMSICEALLQMKVNLFAESYSQEDEDEVYGVIRMITKKLGELNEKTGIDILTEAFQTKLAQIIYVGAMHASKAAESEFGTDPRYQDSNRWMEVCIKAQDRCLDMLVLAYGHSYDDDLKYEISSNYISIATTVRDSCSYKFDYNYGKPRYVVDLVLSDSSKEHRTYKIDMWKDRKIFHNPKYRTEDFLEVEKRCDDIIGKLEESLALSNYWEQHADEKASLEGEKKSLTEQIEQLNASKYAVSLYDTRKRIEDNMKSLISQKNSLGIFKGKEKKALQEQVDALQTELKNIETEIDASDAQYDSQIEPLEARIDEIDKELTMERGRTPLAHGTPITIFVAGKRELAMSPIEMLEFLKSKTPKPYGLKTVDTLLNPAEWRDEQSGELSKYSILFYNGKTETETSLHFDAKSTTSAIEGSLRFIMFTSKFTPDDAVEFVTIVSALIFDMLPSVEMAVLIRVLAAGIYGIKEIVDSAISSSAGIMIGFERNGGVRVTISQE